MQRVGCRAPVDRNDITAPCLRNIPKTITKLPLLKDAADNQA